jgi:L-ascorbate metabolism protein UlaG (beta-lactamase superfamily)
MIRPLLALAAGFLLAGAGAAADTKKLVIRWHGQSFFEVITSQGTRVVFDPHAIEDYGRIAVKADLVLISHFHNDHTQIDVVENKAQAKVLTGLKANGKKIDWNPIDEKFRDIHVRSVATYHDNAEGMERGKNTVFILEVDGLHLVFLGDLGHLLTPAQVKAIGPVDVLFIPVGGVYTLNGSEAKKVVEQLKPRQYVIPMHYGTDVYDELLPAREFLEDQKDVKRLRGNKLEVDPEFKPEVPVVAVLHWKELGRDKD